MYDDELERVQKILERFVARGFFKAKTVHLFGVSINTRQIAQLLRLYHVEPVAVVDNDETRQGSYCARLPVISIHEIKDIADKDNIFVICSAYWREMMRQLLSCGVSKKCILLFYGKKKKSVLRLMCEAGKGLIIYKKIMHKYGNAPMYLCPYTGTGDVYLIGTFWKSYCEAYHVNRYVFAVISNACKKTASLFNIDNMELLEKKRYVSYLISARMLLPGIVNLKLLNDCWPQIHTNQIEWFRGYKGLHFTYLFRRYVFELPDSVSPVHPVYKNADEALDEIFQKKNLVYGRTVVLSPYSNTLADLPDAYWENLAGELSRRGYVVCTNSSGRKESAVSGTVPVFFSLDIAPQFIEKAGFFIGIRSGFCDIISGCCARKIILYDARERFFMGSAFEYFSLKKMELCDDAVEIVFDNKKLDGTIEEILTYF